MKTDSHSAKGKSASRDKFVKKHRVGEDLLTQHGVVKGKITDDSLFYCSIGTTSS